MMTTNSKMSGRPEVMSRMTPAAVDHNKHRVSGRKWPHLGTTIATVSGPKSLLLALWEIGTLTKSEING